MLALSAKNRRRTLRLFEFLVNVFIQRSIQRSGNTDCIKKGRMRVVPSWFDISFCYMFSVQRSGVMGRGRDGGVGDVERDGEEVLDDVAVDAACWPMRSAGTPRSPMALAAIQLLSPSGQLQNSGLI